MKPVRVLSCLLSLCAVGLAILQFWPTGQKMRLLLAWDGEEDADSFEFYVRRHWRPLGTKYLKTFRGSTTMFIDAAPGTYSVRGRSFRNGLASRAAYYTLTVPEKPEKPKNTVKIETSDFKITPTR